MASNAHRAQFLPAVATTVPAAGLLVFPILRVRPNRVAEGVSLGLAQIESGAPLVGILAMLGLSYLTMYLRRGPAPPAVVVIERWLPVLWAVAITVLPWIVVALASAPATAAFGGDPVHRFVPGPGIGLALIAALAGWHEVLQRHNSRWERIVLSVLLALSLAIVAAIVIDPRMAALAYRREYHVQADRFRQEGLTHLRLTVLAVSFAALIGLPAGVIAYRHERLRAAILGVTNAVQTIPSLALFGLLIAPLSTLSRAVPVVRALGISGVGTAPALIALTLYALLPIVRNTVVGFSQVPGAVRESGVAMGMNGRQRWVLIEVPLALPLVLRGLRTAAVQAVGTTTVAALIGAGGFGWFIFQGLGQAATDLVVLGVIPVVLLAVLVDRAFSLVAHRALVGAGQGEPR